MGAIFQDRQRIARTPKSIGPALRKHLLRKFFNIFFWFPLGILLILLSVANRKFVTFSLDPSSTTAPALSFELPLFVLLFAALAIGVLIGSGITWTKQGKHRKALREKSFEANKLRRENEQIASDHTTNQPSEIAPGLPLVSRN